VTRLYGVSGEAESSDPYIRIRGRQRNHTLPTLECQAGPYLGEFQYSAVDEQRPVSGPSRAAFDSNQFQDLETS
jgi:hypothetical protein